MASLDSALTRATLARGIVRRVTNDLAVGLRLWYKGTGTVTSVAATQATSVVLTTSDGGTDTYLFSAYSTLGALCDAINADGIFEAKVMDALRSENPDDFFVTTAGQAASTDEDGNVCYDLAIDADAALTFSCLLSPRTSKDAPKGHRVSLLEVDYLVNNTAAFDTLSIVDRKISTGEETVIYAATNTDNSAASLTFASGNGKITLKDDHELVVQFDGTVVNAADGYIQCIGIYE